MGAKWKYASETDVFNDIAASVPSFKGMSYLRLGFRGMKFTKQEKVTA